MPHAVERQVAREGVLDEHDVAAARVLELLGARRCSRPVVRGARAAARPAIRRSISASASSGSLKPSAPKILMPLSWYGLWLALITMPASARMLHGEVRHRRASGSGRTAARGRPSSRCRRRARSRACSPRGACPCRSRCAARASCRGRPRSVTARPELQRQLRRHRVLVGQRRGCRRCRTACGSCPWRSWSSLCVAHLHRNLSLLA